MAGVIAAVGFCLVSLGLVTGGLIEARIGTVPRPQEVVAWVGRHRRWIAAVDEVLVITSVVGVIAAVAAWHACDAPPLALSVAVVLVVVAGSVGAAASILHGRLVYPIGALATAQEQAVVALIVSAYYAALHVMALIGAAALVAFGIALLGGLAGTAAAMVTFMLAGGCVVLSFSYALPRGVSLALMGVASVWCVWVAVVVASW